MGTPFMGEIKLVAFNYPPKGWAFCNGQLLPINQNQALFSLLGTTYGGNGQTNFALPDLRGRVPVHAGWSGEVVRGQAGGEIAHTLTQAEMPAHQHSLSGSVAVATSGDPAGALLARKGRLGRDMFTGSANTLMAPLTVGNLGGSQPHMNMQPYLVLNYAIALQGVFPSMS